MPEQTAENILLFIFPRKNETKEPLIDEYTQKMVYALRNPVESNVVVGCVDERKRSKTRGLAHISKGVRTMGVHTCVCGATSESADYGIKIGEEIVYTNSLASHYLAFHRDEVPLDQLSKIRKIEIPGDCKVEPTSDELAFHRDEVPLDQLSKIRKIEIPGDCKVEPTSDELGIHGQVSSRILGDDELNDAFKHLMNKCDKVKVPDSPLSEEEEDFPEFWKPHPSFQSYEISNKGNVRRIDSPNKNLKITVRNGCNHVGLTKHGKRRVMNVGYLVAETWLLSPGFGNYIVEYKDKNPRNANVENLELKKV